MKLSLRQIKALKASISHWKRNASASSFNEVQIGPEFCALCKNYWVTSCKNCPVKLHTKKSFCGGTPWERCSCSKMGGDFLSLIEAAKAELRFLQSILAEAGQ
jgi:hypothetical protein